MPRPIPVDIFAEDAAHERFLTALLRRLAREHGVRVEARPVVTKGGHGRVIAQFVFYQRTVSHSPALVIVGTDANCVGWARARGSIDAVVERSRLPRVVIATPDPHIERWYVSDPESLARVLDVKIALERHKCARDVYKSRLAAGLRAAGYVLRLGGAEFADEIVESMDLFRAGKNDASLKHCVDDLRAALKELAG